MPVINFFQSHAAGIGAPIGSLAVLWTLFATSVQLATKPQFKHLESKFDIKFNALESKFDIKFNALESKFDAKFNALETRFDAKFAVVDSRLINLESSVQLLAQGQAQMQEDLRDIKSDLKAALRANA
ncbi:MAG: hypothetical protein WA902_03010 [Thermosynechococcaceae cyanobacterium]